MAQHPALHIIDKRVLDFINPDFEIEMLDDTCTFSEGPVWNREGYYLFSDIPGNKVCRIARGRPKEDFIFPSGFTGEDASVLSDQVGSNGLAYNRQNQLL